MIKPGSLLLALLVAAGCDREPPQDAGVASFHDTPEWRLDSAPLFVLGGPNAPPPETWTNFGAITRFDSGTLLIGDTYTGEVRFFNNSGKHVQTIGGRGEGPGEFSEMWGVYLGPGDTVWAIDNPSGKIQGFVDGKYQRTMQLRRGAMAGMMGSRPVVTVRKVTGGPNNQLGQPQREPGLVRDSIFILVQDNQGNDADTLAVALASESYLSRARNWETPLLGRNSYIAVGSSFVAKGDGGDTLVVVFGERGDTLGTIHVAPITGDAFSTLVGARREYRVAQGRSVAEVTGIKAMLEEMPLADRLTDISALVAADDMHVWLRRVFLPNDSTAEWRVYSTTGAAVAKLQIPTRYRLRHISNSEVVATYRDETDVTRVALLRVLK